MTFLLAYLNVHYLILLSMVHEYAYFYEYIWKMVYWSRKIIPENCLAVFSAIARISKRNVTNVFTRPTHTLQSYQHVV